MKPTTPNCTQQQLEILRHTLGLRNDCRLPYRNHYVVYPFPGSPDMENLETLESLGLMRRVCTQATAAGQIIFCATDAGHELALDSLALPDKAKLDELDALRAERDQLQAALAEANGMLVSIGDYAQAHSTGPAVPDALWEIRCMAYGEQADKGGSP